ncbi:MAG: deoxyuridine 5'-triphosphate nucleotidohydrolase [Thermomicrobiales bacterium]|nr:deoxyuridine 5'-triphosphate nucleotidohydrolase [Thermomicrobiales bacterium]
MENGPAGVLSREDLRERILGPRPLIEGWVDLETQLQPNGFDLSLRAVARLDGRGMLAADNANRQLPDYDELSPDAEGYLVLPAGPYQVVFNEIVDLPPDLMALGRPRSSLCRSGATLYTAVWDAGYRGRSMALLHVINSDGLVVQRDARLLQLIFFGLARASERGYDGVYQGERIVDNG